VPPKITVNLRWIYITMKTESHDLRFLHILCTWSNYCICNIPLHIYTYTTIRVPWTCVLYYCLLANTMHLVHVLVALQTISYDQMPPASSKIISNMFMYSKCIFCALMMKILFLLLFYGFRSTKPWDYVDLWLFWRETLYSLFPLQVSQEQSQVVRLISSCMELS
jgi:hypothetical protein